jgi:antitoxin (DNA-binding transcriptional repressor) of toxin-antitoxin stability system
MEAILWNLHDAKTDLSPLVEQALDGADVVGEDVVKALAGRALTRLVPVVERPRQRRLGFLQGDVVLSCALSVVRARRSRGSWGFSRVWMCPASATNGPALPGRR